MRILLRSSIKAPVMALEDVSFGLERGHICAVVGPNGAGKSTMFRILTGLITPTTGSASICGLDVTHRSFEVRRLIGFHPGEDRTLMGRHTCRENLAFHGKLQGLPPRRLRGRVDEVLELVGLGQARSRVVFALSSGMRARLQLARALLHRPAVLILDEPTSALDPVASYQFLEMIQQAVAEDQIAALISSHRLEDIEALHDYVLLLDQGRVVYQGNLDALRALWQEPRLEVQFDNAEASTAAAQFLAGVEGVQVVSQDGERLVLITALSVGGLFGTSNGQLNGVRSISEARMPLRELLAKVLHRPGDG
ncbi:MAG: ABC transporter ATP-binding protein [Acidimicrobiia bacterium]